ncbi:restriction endonuclease subunit S [Synechococcus sp. BA-132 BA5]|uniref:restriction endonuclease subunit S n=1 Tax=Synechococcus sp. BA-132 BA5 TaxID=3110252 RepID=UPI002B21682F|nr:restriction endonuclease subunit S [Synechococcus sp. BA-132 BA5]MEA5416216.1 restriction endonuclease subunit S [Synechococcus sp. BA-132 BA5]
MNAEQLLQHFERISEAPDALPRLRRFILDLAVRGKLVEQDPSDEPASELLKRIAAEKARLVKDGRIKKAEAVANLTASFDVFCVPTGWAVSNLQSICQSVTDGDHLPPPKAETGIPFLVIGNVRSQKIEFEGSRFVPNSYYDALDSIRRPRSGDLLYTLVGSYGIPVLVRDDQPFCVQRHIGILRPSALINVGFLARAMESRFAYEQATACATGIAQKTVSLSGLRKLMLPLPPLAEQHRIVVKVDELMSLCDQLEAAKAEREKCRDSLVAASLQGLNQPAEKEAAFREHARFTFNNLPRITTRAVHIKQLRQTILNLAVRGKLVEQAPSDEPASELLKRIGAEKARLVKAGKIKREKPLPPISQSDKAFEVPSGWEWVRLGDLTMLVTSGSRDWAKHYSNNGAIFVRMGNLSKDHYRLRLDHIQRVKAPADGEGTRTRLEPGDILISITGEVGMLGLIPDGFGEAYINQHTAMVRPVAAMKGRYLAELFRSQFAQAQFKEPQRGIKNSFRLTDVTQFVVPLPPLAEQHRIVAKVDELMAICDQLETQITATEQDSRRFLESVLADALAPGIDLRAVAQVA